MVRDQSQTTNAGKSTPTVYKKSFDMLISSVHKNYGWLQWGGWEGREEMREGGCDK